MKTSIIFKDCGVVLRYDDQMSCIIEEYARASPLVFLVVSTKGVLVIVVVVVVVMTDFCAAAFFLGAIICLFSLIRQCKDFLYVW